MKLLKSLFLILFASVLSPCLLQSQVNSINRIDSLTHVFMEKTISQPLANMSTDEVLNLNEQQFYSLVNRLGSAIPFSYEPAVVTQIRYMKNPSSTFLLKAWNRKNQYFRVFEEVLDRKGMPDEIKYLSIVESLLSTNAVSWCGATGLWQFMPATGRMMDLAIDAHVDERKDIYKSTEKACDYLLSMYHTYNDWLLALAAYNGGPGNVNRAIRLSGGKRTFWEIRKHLPKETQNYVPKFLATAFLMSFSPPAENEDDHILRAHETLVPVYLCCEVDMKYVCALVNVSEAEQMEWNSVYKNGFIPRHLEEKRIVLPYKQAMQLAEWQDSVYAISTNSFQPERFIQKDTRTVYHTVAKGQTIRQVAVKYGVSTAEIMRWNRMSSSRLKAGRRLKIHLTKISTLPVSQPNAGFYYFISDYESQTVRDICGRFAEFDLDRTCSINGIVSPDTPLGKGRLIRLYLITN